MMIGVVNEGSDGLRRHRAVPKFIVQFLDVNDLHVIALGHAILGQGRNGLQKIAVADNEIVSLIAGIVIIREHIGLDTQRRYPLRRRLHKIGLVLTGVIAELKRVGRVRQQVPAPSDVQDGPDR